MNTLRLALADAKIALRQVKDAYEIARAIAEQNAIEGGCSGKNEAERSRNLAVALLSDDAYNAALRALRSCEADVDRIAAQLATEEDMIRMDEARIREKLADALMGRRMDDAVIDYRIFGQ
jgi:hypothetical protein